MKRSKSNNVENDTDVQPLRKRNKNGQLVDKKKRRFVKEREAFACFVQYCAKGKEQEGKKPRREKAGQMILYKVKQLIGEGEKKDGEGQGSVGSHMRDKEKTLFDFRMVAKNTNM